MVGRGRRSIAVGSRAVEPTIGERIERMAPVWRVVQLMVRVAAVLALVYLVGHMLWVLL
jgi:hypothetical protein